MCKDTKQNIYSFVLPEELHEVERCTTLGGAFKKQRMIMIMKYIKLMSWEEICSNLGMKRNHAFVLHSRAIKKLNK